MRVRLTRKLADCIDGIDLSKHQVGEVLDLPHEQARLLLAEAWATPDTARPDGESRAAASDAASRRRRGPRLR